MQKNAVEHEYRSWQRLALRCRDGTVRAMVEDSFAIASRATGADRVEESCPQGGIVVGIREKSLGGIAPARVSYRPGMVEPIHGRAYDRPVGILQNPRELVGECGVACAID